jgi:predicted nuclease with TOPRIM domain
LKGFLLNPEHVSDYLQKASATINEKQRLVDTLTKELERVTAEVEKTYQLYLTDGITSEQFKERHQPLDDRKKQITEELPKAEADISLLKIDGLSSEYIMAEARDVESCWPDMSTEEKQRIVESLVKRITVASDAIEFSLCYLPSFREMSNRQRMVRGSLRRRA